MIGTHPLPTGAHVAFDIEELVVGTAEVAEVQHDQRWLYRLAAVEMTRGDAALLKDLADVEADGSAWFCEHEVRPLAAEVTP